MSRLIALLTDFGIEDIYVGVMKGVMKNIALDAQFIDISHFVPAQSIQNGALALRNSYHYFPAGTTFLVVIDPTVGSERRPIIVDAGGYRFIAPDNGVLTYILEHFEDYRAAAITNTGLYLPDSSYTFHGRDIFAPAAAHAANGVPIAEFGEIIHDPVQLPAPVLNIEDDRVQGEMTHIDHFGNCISSIGRFTWKDRDTLVLTHHGQSTEFDAARLHIRCKDNSFQGVKHAYHEVAQGEALVQIDSNGYLEIAINQGNAAQRFGYAIGDHLEISS